MICSDCLISNNHNTHAIKIIKLSDLNNNELINVIDQKKLFLKNEIELMENRVFQNEIKNDHLNDDIKKLLTQIKSIENEIKSNKDENKSLSSKLQSLYNLFEMKLNDEKSFLKFLYSFQNLNINN